MFSWPQATKFRGEINMNMFNVTVVIQFSAVEDSGVPYIAIVQLQLQALIVKTLRSCKGPFTNDIATLNNQR